jgi:hypothetical protein
MASFSISMNRLSFFKFCLILFVGLMVTRCSAQQLASMRESSAETADNAGNSEAAQWSVKIVPYSYYDESGPLINFHSPFQVVVTNMSDTKQKLWKEWCSWGYFNISFEVALTDGTKCRITKKMRDWTRNGPDYLIVEPRNHFVYNVRFADDIWQGFPKQMSAQDVKINAVFEVQPDDQSEKLGVWTGRIESENVSVRLHK